MRGKSLKKRDSVFQEAWENMNNDMAKVMPGFIARRMQGGKNKAWVMVVMMIVELIILGVVGKFLYDWLTS